MTRADQVTTNTSNETEFTSFNGTNNYGSTMTVTGNSLLRNLDAGTDTGRGNFNIVMPVTISTGAVLTMHNTAAGNFNNNPLSFQGIANHANDLTMQAGSTIITTGSGESRFGSTSNGKPIVGQGTPGSEALMQLGAHAWFTDTGTNAANPVTKLVVNGSGSAGLRFEAAMNATYVDRNVDTSLITDGTTGLLGINTTSTMEGGSPPSGYSVMGNAYTVLAPKRLNTLTGSGGTLTIAANDATDATGRISHGPDAAVPVRVAMDNTPSSAAANLVYEIDPQANGNKFLNFAGLDVKRTSSGAGSVKAKIVNSAAKLPDVSVSNGTQIDVNDQKLILSNMPLGTWDGSAYSGVTGLVQAGRGDGSWNGSGLVTSQTDATTSVLTTLAVTTGAIRNGLGPTDTESSPARPSTATARW